MASQQSQTLLTLNSNAVSDLKEGINFLRNKEDGKNYIIYKSMDVMRACKNQCKHQGGLFVKDIEDLDESTVRCTKHNWKLNVSTMKYVNPPDCFQQDELVLEPDENGGLQLLELNPPDPWQADPRTPEELEPGEVLITYMTHACMKLDLGSKTMVFDPWLAGPAFARGWWLLHEPPSDWLETICSADLIYISHMHSDHLSYPTLKKIAEKQPNIPIYVGDTSRPVFWYLDRSGVKLTNINVVPFGIWQEVDANLRFMILMDGIHPEMDTCIIVEYKGHKILNTVDCTRPNGGVLPKNVDVMMSDFAGGASGFPMTFSGGKYTEKWKADFIKTERKKLLNYKSQLVKDLQPKVYCPFAGYFVEAHPSDSYIKETNLKNNPEELNVLITKTSFVSTWTPKSGAVLDMARILKDPLDSEAIIDPPAGTKLYKDNWEFDVYVNEINTAISNEIFQHKDWINFYYNWAGFRDYNLVIRVPPVQYEKNKDKFSIIVGNGRKMFIASIVSSIIHATIRDCTVEKMIETNDDFSPLHSGFDYLVDFLDLSFPNERPARDHFYLEIKNRVGVMRQTVIKGLLWDDLYIGFQNRLFRDPDIYHHQFWNHFQIKLPLTPPDWDSYLQSRVRQGCILQ